MLRVLESELRPARVYEPLLVLITRARARSTSWRLRVLTWWNQLGSRCNCSYHQCFKLSNNSKNKTRINSFHFTWSVWRFSERRRRRASCGFRTVCFGGVEKRLWSGRGVLPVRHGWVISILAVSRTECGMSMRFSWDCEVQLAVDVGVARSKAQFLVQTAVPRLELSITRIKISYNPLHHRMYERWKRKVQLRDHEWSL